jgi:hypothetical protein
MERAKRPNRPKREKEPMGKVIVPHIVSRKPKTGYYVDGKGNLWERPMRGGRSGAKGKVIVPHAVERQARTLYYVDGKGNLCASPMKRRR